MKISTAGFAALLTLVGSVAGAADWFDNVAGVVPRVEPWSDGSIWLARPLSSLSAVALLGRSSSCSITQIHLIPPAGQERAWLAVLLSAMAAGQAISVYGDCVPANSRIDATRLVIE